MIKNEKPFLTEKEKIAMAMNNAGDGQGLIMDMSGKTLEDVVKAENIKKANKEMEVYAEAFKKHTEELEKATNQLALNPEDVEIMPIGNYVLVKEFKTNPFQKIAMTEHGVITDLGGFAPVFKNTDNGEWEQEEEFIICGAIQEVGPDVKWLKPGDAVFYPKPCRVPLPFYKTGLVKIAENQVIAVVNEKLKERFDNVKKKA